MILRSLIYSQKGRVLKIKTQSPFPSLLEPGEADCRAPYLKRGKWPMPCPYCLDVHFSPRMILFGVESAGV
jgi:hypothetical protein